MTDKFHGPYKRDDGRQHVVVTKRDGSKTSKSYAKYILEKKLNRKLRADETTDHKDGYKTNNDPSNLRAIDRAEHTRQDTRRNKPQSFKCPSCKVSFELQGRPLTVAVQNRKQNKSGPFCSKRCAGTYGTDIQNKNRKEAVVRKLKAKYTTLKIEDQK
jgi:endogenous inhibitor of DNA gyrase (YacG/DUF329 family)